MESTEILQQIVYPVTQEFRGSVSRPDRLKSAPDTKLFGPNGALDSIAFVSFLLALESKTREVTQKSIRILDAKAFSQKQNPFENLAAVANYLQDRLNDPT
jgi:hypothetical protein